MIFDIIAHQILYMLYVPTFFHFNKAYNTCNIWNATPKGLGKNVSQITVKFKNEETQFSHVLLLKDATK